MDGHHEAIVGILFLEQEIPNFQILISPQTQFQLSDSAACRFQMGEFSERSSLLAEFSRGDSIEISSQLNCILNDIAGDGKSYYNWDDFKFLVMKKIEQVVDLSNAEVPYVPTADEALFERKQRLFAALQEFEGAPFTIQRIAEILVQPRRHYKSTNKLLNCLDKLLSVSSIIPRFNPNHQPSVDCNIEESVSQRPEATSIVNEVKSNETHFPTIEQDNQNGNATVAPWKQ